MVISLKDALSIATNNNNGMVIKEYAENESMFLFAVNSANGPSESAYFYKVDKSTGDHGVFDYWAHNLFDATFSISEFKKL